MIKYNNKIHKTALQKEGEIYEKEKTFISFERYSIDDLFDSGSGFRGGELAIGTYNAVTGEIRFDVSAEDGYKAVLSGLPSDAEQDDDHITCTVNGNLNVTARFTPTVGFKFTDKKTKSVVKIIGTKKVEYIGSSKGKTASSVKVPSSVTIEGVKYQVVRIADEAFYKYTRLKSVTLPSTITRIEEKAFYKCTALTKITIPSKVKYIESKAFYGCKKLKKITIKTTKLTSKTMGSKVFTGIYKTAAIKVPKKKLAAYRKLLKKKGIGSSVTVTY